MRSSRILLALGVLSTLSAACAVAPKDGAPEATSSAASAVTTNDIAVMTVIHPVSGGTGECLDIAGASQGAGAALIQWACHGQANQLFELHRTTNSEEFTIVANHSGQCLDVLGGSTAPGTAVAQWTCAPGAPNQTFAVSFKADGSAELKAKHSGLCLEVPAGPDGTQLVQNPCSGAANQSFILPRKPPSLLAVGNEPTPDVVVLGDSLSDIENMYKKTYGGVPISVPGFWNGRFSNGYNWYDYFNQDNGYDGTARPNGKRLRNLAVGGAQVIASPILRDSLRDQAVKLNKEKANFNAPFPNGQSLFVLFGGGNDVTTAVRGGTFTTDVPNNVNEAQQAGTVFGRKLANELYQVRIFIESMTPGGQTKPKFLLVGLPDISVVPAARMENWSVYQRTYAQAASLAYNQALSAAVDSNRIFYADVATLFRGIDRGTDKDVNLSDVNRSCLSKAGLPYSDKSVPCSVKELGLYQASVGSYTDRACAGDAFFDGLHPTSYAHCSLSKMMETAMQTAGVNNIAVGGDCRLRPQTDSRAVTFRVDARQRIPAGQESAVCGAAALYPANYGWGGASGDITFPDVTSWCSARSTGSSSSSSSSSRLAMALQAASPPVEHFQQSAGVDYDGDEISDLTMFSPATGSWTEILSGGGAASPAALGQPGDIPVQADFDADGKVDQAVFRPNDGTWNVVFSETGSTGTTQWGTTGDVPFTGDADQDGVPDLTVYRPSEGKFYVLTSATRDTMVIPVGQGGDIPITGDYDGDTAMDFGVYRPSNGTFYIVMSMTGDTVATPWSAPAGAPAGAVVPLTGDFDGDGVSDYAVWQGCTQSWFIKKSSTGATQSGSLPVDTPMDGDFDGDGLNDLAGWSAGSHTWIIQQSSNGSIVQRTQAGAADAIPVGAPNTCMGGTCTQVAAPACGFTSCQDVKARSGSSLDGERVLYVGGHAMSVYCQGMGGAPTEYLSLQNTANDANYSTIGEAGNTSPGGVRTNFSRVRFHPDTLTVDLADYTFATSNGGAAHYGTSTFTNVPYANASDCVGGWSQTGRGNVDMTGTPFVIVPNQFESVGWAQAGSATYSRGGQVVDLTGGGYCGGEQPASGALRLAIPDAGAVQWGPRNPVFAGTPMTLSWQAVPGATWYTVRITRDDGTTVSTRTVPATSTSSSYVLQGADIYHRLNATVQAFPLPGATVSGSYYCGNGQG